MSEDYSSLFLKHHLAGDYQKAIEAFEQVLKANPKDVRVLFQIGNVHSLIGKDKKAAVAAYSRVLKIDPSHASSRFNRGRCYQEIGEFKKALRDFNTSMKSEDSSDHRRFRGACHFQLKDFKRAAVDFNKAIEYLDEEIRLRRDWPTESKPT